MRSTPLRLLPLLGILAVGACGGDDGGENIGGEYASPADSIAPAPREPLVPGADEPGPQEDGQ